MLQLASAIRLVPAPVAAAAHRSSADLPAAGAIAQLATTSAALQSCALLAERLDMSSSDSLRVAAAVQPVLQGSPRLLSAARASQRAMQPGTLAELAAHCFTYAQAVGAVMDLLCVSPERRDAAAAFAASTARPQVLLPWLREMAQLLMVLPAYYPDDNSEQTCALWWGLWLLLAGLILGARLQPSPVQPCHAVRGTFPHSLPALVTRSDDERLC